ncbi:MAG: hypothetical protein M3459_09615 [Actinomycetota bacterium]|nr:hypothetical protein [Actinomycetota bacterium]
MTPTGSQLTALLEWACTVYWRAAAVGTPRTLGADDVARAHDGLMRVRGSMDNR